MYTFDGTQKKKGYKTFYAITCRFFLHTHTSRFIVVNRYTSLPSTALTRDCFLRNLYTYVILQCVLLVCCCVHMSEN